MESRAPREIAQILDSLVNVARYVFMAGIIAYKYYFTAVGDVHDSSETMLPSSLLSSGSYQFSPARAPSSLSPPLP